MTYMDPCCMGAIANSKLIIIEAKINTQLYQIITYTFDHKY